jgi:hypothetical protein
MDPPTDEKKRKLEPDADDSPKRRRKDEKPRRPSGRDSGKRNGRGEFLYVADLCIDRTN